MTRKLCIQPLHLKSISLLRENAYPKIFFPFNYISILKSEPPRPKEPTKPEQPKEPKQPEISIQRGGCLADWIVFSCLVVSIICFVSAFSEKKPGQAIILGVISFGVFAIGIYSNIVADEENRKEFLRLKKQYEDDRAGFEKLMKEYKTALEIYTLQKEFYQKALNEASSKNVISQYRHKQIKKFLINIPGDNLNEDDSAFYRENRDFCNLLLRHFEVLFFKNSITVLVDDGFVIAVDVRIDVPYDAANGRVLSSSTNDYLIQKDCVNRAIIIFAEEQTVLQPRECAQFIVYVCTTLKLLKPFTTKPNYPTHIKAWSKESATLMAFRKFRSKYMGNYDPKIYADERLYFDNYIDQALKRNAVDDLPNDLPF